MINFSTKVCPRRQCRGSCFFASMAMAFLSIVFSAEKSSAQGDKILVRGTVIDETGGPLPGATVREKGTSNGVAADVEGEYKIRVSGSDAILIISSVGYIPKEETVGGRQEVNISLNEKVQELDEVVVVGFGEQRKVSVVGAQSTISSEDLKMPVANVNQLLAGRISGVIGVQRSGEPGRSGADIWIRGLVFGGSSSPLVLVDGVERDMSTLDPQDIASFTILKDASGTAVYGVRGANGVVLITTKKGRVGKPQIALDYSEGITSFVKLPQMADAKTYMEARNESKTTRGQQPEYPEEYMKKTLSGEDPELYPNVDWMKTLFKDFGHVRRANMNVSGGSDFLKYYGSLSYYDESGLLNTDGVKSNYDLDLRFRRFNVTTNVKMDITKTTELEVGIRGYFTNFTNPYIGAHRVFETAFATAPTEFPLEYTGGFIPGKNPNSGNRSPWADLTRRGYYTNFSNNLNSNVQLTQNLNFLTPGLKAAAMFSFDALNEYDTHRQLREATYQPDLNKPRNDDGSLNLSRTFQGDGDYLGYNRYNRGNRRYYSQTSLTYDGKFDVHRVGALALFYTDDYLDPFAGDIISSIPRRYLGLAGRVTYSYDDRYLIEGNVGYNGSELFTPKNRYGAFPAIGVGWVISNEKFFAPLKKAISYLKIRYTDGITGIGIIGDRRFAYLTLMNDNAEGYRFHRNFDHTSGMRVREYGSDIVWAKSHKQDLGVEFKLHEDHLSVIVDFFRDSRTGIFLKRETVPRYLGLVSNPWGNLGEFENKGIDGSMIYNHKIGKVEVSFRANATYNQDKIINNDQPKPKYEWMDRRGTNVIARFGYVAEKLFETQEEIDDIKTGVPGDRSQVLPGDIKYQDLNGDGLINNYDERRIGRGDVPYLVFGFGFNVGYKGFNLGAFFTGQRGADIMLWGDGIRPFANGSGVTNIYSNITDRWQESNPRQNVFYPRLASGTDKNRNNSHGSTWWLRSTDFMRMKTFELNYKFPSSALKNTFKGVTAYFQCFNPLTFTKFDLWDVESTMNGGNGGRYPNIRSYNLGLLFNF